MAMRVSKKIRLYAVTLFSIFAFSCSPSHSCEPGPEHGLGLHTGILEVCKNYMLGGELPNFSVNDDNPKFREIETWVKSNLLSGCYIAAKIDGKERAKYWIVLNSTRMPQKDVPSSVSKMLVSIPLTSQTLGPKYKEKITELKKLMSKKSENQAE